VLSDTRLYHTCLHATKKRADEPPAQRHHH
jgi:hypothetical protein